MKFIGIALIVVGVLALVASTIGFGDIGLSFGATLALWLSSAASAS